MDAQQFLAEFGHIANAPGGVTRLRELVLHLAVSGDLVATESLADALPLLDAIERQKREHPDKKKVIPKQAPLSRAVVKVPPHWAVCRLGDLALTVTGGGTPSKNQLAYWGGEIPWASVKDMKELKFLDETEDHITPEGLKDSSSNLIPPGRVIVCTRMGLGKIAINRVALAINQDLKALELPEEVNSDFFLILYKTRELTGTGTTVSGIKQDQLFALPAALPPVEEQARIVAKVDELMALCDKLEAQQQARRKLQNHLRQSTLQAVANSQSPHELQTHWTRLADNFGELFDAPEDVDSIRKAILTLAFNGRLRTSSELTKHVPLASILAESSVNGVSKGPTSDTSRTEVLKISAGTSRTDFNVDEEDFKHVHLSASEIEKFRLMPGDLLACRYNGNLRYVGRFSYYRGRSGRTQANPDKLIRFRIAPEHDSRYVCLVINAEPARRIIEAMCATTAGNIGLSAGRLKTIMIPLPPLAEQQRIVQRVEYLMGICDLLELQLRNAKKMAGRFVNSATQVFTGLTVEPEEEPMKAPQTELIALLRLGKTPDIKAQAPLATLLARHNSEMSAKDLWQRFGGEIDAFYAQLKTEVAQGWIAEPAPAEMREKPAVAVSA